MSDISQIQIKNGVSFGALYVINHIAQKLRIKDALTSILIDEKQVNIALWQIIFKAIHHGSKLSSIRNSDGYAIFDVLNLDKISKHDIYNNLSILSKNAKEIEKSSI